MSTCKFREGSPTAMSVLLDVVDEDLVLLRRPWTFLKPALVAARGSSHRWTESVIRSLSIIWLSSPNLVIYAEIQGISWGLPRCSSSLTAASVPYLYSRLHPWHIAHRYPLSPMISKKKKTLLYNQYIISERIFDIS